MNFKSILISAIFSFGLLYGSVGSAAETVKPSSKTHQVNSGFKPAGETVEEILKGDVFKKKFTEQTVLKKYRELRGCAGPNFEKDLLSKKSPEPAMKCSDLLTYDGAKEKSNDLAKMCKAGCLNAGKGSAKGNSASALENCLDKNCEKECDFKNSSRKVELDSFIRGALNKGQYDADSL